jgi:pimeloyl-ACP methyl ester carboxylesterase
MTRKTLPLSDGSTLGYIEQGQGAPVVLIHGVGLCAEAWGPQIDALSAAHHVYALDMPGHGTTSPLPAIARLPEYVAWAARAITALQAPVSLAGHSMGALIALGLGVDHPGLVTRIAALTPVHRRAPAAKAAVLNRAAEIARGEGCIDAPLARWFTPAEAPIRAQVAHWLSTVSAEGYATAYRAFAEGDATYADRLSQIRCPALILTADGDANSTPEMTRAIAAACHGTALVIENHRHMVNLTAPTEVTAALQTWLTTQKVPA